MKLTKKALLYDISNLAYLIADTGEDGRHTLHRVRDICEDGNIDRISRLLGLAFTEILDILKPIVESPAMDVNHDFTAVPRDYEIKFRKETKLSSVVRMRIKETAREYMVSRVLADWLSLTLPETAETCKTRLGLSMQLLKETAEAAEAEGYSVMKRRVSPI